MKTIYIVTGACGFLGNHLVRRLCADRENEVRAFALPEDNFGALAGLDCRIYKGDVTRKETLGAVFSLPEDTRVYVIHCAAIVSIKSKHNPRMREVNVNGTKNVIEKVLETKAKLVYVSSVHAIPEKPHGEVMTEVDRFSPDQVEGQYAKTKAEISDYLLACVQREGLDACIVHPSGMIGPNDFGGSHLTQLIVDFARGRLRACVKGGYDFVDVRDVADGIISACTRGRAGECYILSNRYIEVRDLLDMVSEARNTKKISTLLPMWLAKLTAPLSECYYAALRQPPLYTLYSLYTLTSNANFSGAKAIAELGYRTRPLEETIADTVAWLTEVGKIGR